MKLSLAEYSVFVSMAVILAMGPNPVMAFAPTYPNGQFHRMNGKGLSPYTTTALNYIDPDKLEIKGLMDNRERNPTKKVAAAAAKWRKQVSGRLSPVVGRWTTVLVARLSWILHLLKDRIGNVMNSMPVIKFNEASPTKLAFGTMSSTVNVMDDTTTATIKVDAVKVNGWSLPTLDLAKDKVTEKGQVTSQEHMVADAVVPTPKKSTPSVPFYARDLPSQSVEKKSQDTDLQAEEPSEESPVTVHNVVDNRVKEEVVLVANRDATTSSSLRPPIMDWSQAQATAVKAMEVAKGAYKVGSMLTTATTTACGPAFAMAREYAAKVVVEQSRNRLPSLVPLPPKVAPSANLFGIQNILLQQQHEGELSSGSFPKLAFKGNFHIDFAAIDDVLMQAESALKLVEELVPSSPSSASAPAPGTNIDFSAIDDVLMEAESALKLVEELEAPLASVSQSKAAQVSTNNNKEDKKESSSPSIGTNMDFSEIDNILMQAESALQLAEVSCM